MKIALYKSKTDNDPKCVDVPWAKLLKELITHEFTDCNPCQGSACPSKNGKAWSPIEIVGRRTNENVKSFSALVYDLDYVSLNSVMQCISNIEGTYIYAAYSTHSHGKNDPARTSAVATDAGPFSLRLVLPFAVALPASGDWARIRQQVAQALQIPCKRDDGKDWARLYFFPSAPTGAQVLAYHGEGQNLNVDEFLAGRPVAEMADAGDLKSLAERREGSIPSGPIAPDATNVIQLVPYSTAPDESVVDLKAARKRLKGCKRARNAISRILDEHALAAPGERDNTVNEVSSTIAWALPNLPIEAFLELIRPSISKMKGSESTDYWLDKAKDSFQRARLRYGEQKEKEQTEAAAVRETLEALSHANSRGRDLAKRDRAGSDSSGAEGQTVADVQGGQGIDARTKLGTAVSDDEECDSWRRHLVWGQDKNGAEFLKSCGHNLSLFLQHDEIWKNAFIENELTHAVEMVGGPLKHLGIDANHYGTEVANFFAANKIVAERMGFTSLGAYEQIAAVASRNRYDPLKEYLNSIKWDGVPRISNWLTTYLNAEVIDLDGNDISRYLQLVGHHWLVGAVARGLAPGCQMDNALVIEGKEFVGKSSALRILGGPFYHRASLNLNDRDGLMTYTSSWIAEFAEGTGLLDNAESGPQKNFLDRTIDKFRMPYARVPLSYPRRCVFVVTHNPETGRGIFKSTTGNRRFWPVRAGNIVNVGQLEKDRDLIWAEAVQVFKAAGDCVECQQLIKAYSIDRCPQHRWWLDRQETAIAEVQTEARTVDVGDLKAQVWDWWATMHPTRRSREFGAVDVAKALKPNDWNNKGLLTQIGMALGKLKFQSKTRRINGAVMRKWVATDELMAVPQEVAGQKKALDATARA